MKILALHHIDKRSTKNFFLKHWGSDEMVTSSGIYRFEQLDGFALIDEKENIIGMITFIMKKDECEIISLDSQVHRQGLGTLLLQQLEDFSLKQGCLKIKLITTNDNLNALEFYQKRGYFLSQIFCHAVDQARKKKPQIPLIANNGIPIRDEIELIKTLH